MSENEALERRVQLSRLYDLYGPLLTERQRRVYEMHELDDLSLSEIADELGISRQGVSDQLQRARDRLDEIETLLGFDAANAFAASKPRPAPSATAKILSGTPRPSSRRAKEGR